MKIELARQSETDPYVAPFGYDVTGRDDTDPRDNRFE